MNYLNQELQDALAAEYVLGTLRGQARVRFQKLMMQNPSLRETTWLWEQHLSGLANNIKPVSPAKENWVNIERRLGFQTVQKSSGLWELLKEGISNWLKPSLSLPIGATLAVVLFLLSFNMTNNSTLDVSNKPVQIAVVQNAEKAPLWIVEITAKTLEIKATKKLQPIPNKDYELWVVAKGESKPISLGILPKTGELSLDKISQFDGLDIQLLAVSLEPLNGSPNGSPTEVLFTTELAIL